MDLILKILNYRKRIFGLLIVLMCLPFLLTAQSIFEQIGRLPVTTYTVEEYGGNPWVVSAIQSDEGLMYFGTVYGLHEYDGVSWRSIFDRNTTVKITSFAKDASGRIFYAGVDFGYLKVDAKGETHAVSLLHQIPNEFEFGIGILSINFLDNYLYLLTRENIIRLELEEDFSLKSLKTWPAETSFTYAFVQGKDYFIHQNERGLFQLVGEEIKLVPGTEILGKDQFKIMLPFPREGVKTFLMGGASTGFYLFDGSSVSKFPTQVDQLIKEGAETLNHALPYEGNYILSFTGAGIVIMNPKGEILNRIGTGQRLPSDYVTRVYLDKSQGLWALTEDGIAKIGIDSPILTFGKEHGIKSEVLSIQKEGNSFFLGTSTGLVTFNEKSKTFQAVPEINQSWIMDLNFDGQDLIIPSSQLQVYRDGKGIRLDLPNDGSRPSHSIIPKNNPNLLLVGTTKGILLYERGISKEFPWELKGKIPRTGPLRSAFFEGKDGTIFTNSSRNWNVLNLEGIGLKSSELTGIKNTVFEDNISEQTFSLVDGEFYIKSPEGMKKYSTKEEKFISTEDFSEVEKDMFDFVQHKTGIIWYESLAGKKFILKRNEAGKFVKDERLNSVAPYLTYCDFLDTDSIMWFGSPKGLIRYDPKKDNQTDKEFFTLIRRIETKTDTIPLLYYGRKKDIAAVERKENSYRFEFAAPYFEEEKKTKYQTFLEGFDPDWVDWNDNKFKEYTNLPPGEYTFRVRAMAYTGRISEEATYSFVVLPPWYSTWWAYLIYALLIGGIITGIIKWRSRKLKAENHILEERVNERTAELEKSLTELKATQAQLIQSEKMASLGVLTAGIAHEIQNPLNFVNNFSEVSKELLAEMKEELATGSKEEAGAIADDVIQNLEKIHHHGKRADAIVKGMLQHSRSGSGAKEPTDINALADEYLRLSYHGLRARDKSFNADFKLDLEPNLPKANVVPQDIGRVLLNLINNAFQACSSEPSKGSKPLEGYMPIVKVSTQNLGDKIEIKVSDNGPGIPDSIKDKIFQPFFTTKPTGQGTGLGLSLSYDILKAHGGEIKLESQSGLPIGENGTVFTVILPIA
jgi:signal transduction histidine kinase